MPNFQISTIVMNLLIIIDPYDQQGILTTYGMAIVHAWLYTYIVITYNCL